MELIAFLVTLAIFLKIGDMLYEKITNPFRTKENPDKIKILCEGCGNDFDHPLHDHYGYKSCSVDCDEMLDEIFNEQTI